MQTDFPEGESATLKLTLASPKTFTLALRRPSWAGEGYSIQVNGGTVRDLPPPGAYAELKRRWRNQDTVQVRLPKALRSEPLPDNPRRVALMWGPLVLAGDLGPEQQGGRRREDASVSESEAFAPPIPHPLV